MNLGPVAFPVFLWIAKSHCLVGGFAGDLLGQIKVNFFFHHFAPYRPMARK